MEMQCSTPTHVTCYSSHTYPGRPDSFVWEGVAHKVQKVEKQWQEPGEKHFLVRTNENRLFELCYSEPGDEWSLIELIGGV